MKRHRKLLISLALVVVMGAAAPLAYRWGVNELNAYFLAKAEQAMELGDFAEAESYAARILARTPHRRAALLAGEAAMQIGRDEQALEYLQPLLGGEDTDAVLSNCAAASICERQGDARRAEKMYRRALEIDPDNAFVQRRLVDLLTIEGRNREALPYRFAMLKGGDYTYDDLLLLGNPRAMVEDEQLKEFEQKDRDNPMWLLFRGQVAFRDSKSKEAATMLRTVVAQMPEFIEGQVALGLALLDTATPDEFWTWFVNVPKGISQHPDYWNALGLWAQRNNQPGAAVRCFWETLRREPNYQTASYQLSVALVADGKQSAAKPFEERANRLRNMNGLVHQLVEKERDDVTTMQKAAKLAESLGRYWEAVGWHRLVLSSDLTNPVSQLALARLVPKLHDDLPRVAPERDPAALADYSTYPLPKIERPEQPDAGAIARHDGMSQEANLAIRFADVTESSGLKFAYFNGEDKATEGRRMFEFTGGGVAVIDYDLDGWPDVYFTQGCHWPPRDDLPTLRDQLFRNLGNGRFEDVTEIAGLGDERFGQGVTSGDYNNDGFPDLWIGNVGLNRLYQNNGDGTFTEVTDRAGVQGDVWTTSCLIADLNGDTLPDLYEVNYLTGNAMELMCRKTCSPAQFPAASDRFFLNRGDGTFEDCSVECGITGQDGKGLAIAAFDFNDSGQLSVFVSNDTTANFFYVNDQPRGGTPQFTESATLRGLAFDREGQAQACMGIAVNDANGDGLLDVFIANFYREFNVLYEQMEGGFFADVSRERGLAEPSYLILTFGTEFVDFDLDGYPDIIATNGHVDDFSKDGAPYHMPPRVFRNIKGNFVDLCESCGPFFEGGYLGRSLVVLDWNRDGKGDWAVSHLDSPAAILENRTEPAGHHLGFTFTGVTSERDATGTTCWVTVGERTTMQQLVGGSGYNAANEKLLLFGLGAADKADRVEVRWPTGERQTFSDVPANCVYRLIEGQDVLHRVARD